jgi:hypothetical protein
MHHDRLGRLAEKAQRRDPALAEKLQALGYLD